MMICISRCSIEYLYFSTVLFFLIIIIVVTTTITTNTITAATNTCTFTATVTFTTTIITSTAATTATTRPLSQLGGATYENEHRDIYQTFHTQVAWRRRAHIASGTCDATRHLSVKGFIYFRKFAFKWHVIWV